LVRQSLWFFGGHLIPGLAPWAALFRPFGAKLAGETREEYEAHVERMREAFAPLSEGDRKLVLAAQAAWRRLRVFGGQGRWELYAVASILGELIAVREAEAERRAAAERAGEKFEPMQKSKMRNVGGGGWLRLGFGLIDVEAAMWPVWPIFDFRTSSFEPQISNRSERTGKTPRTTGQRQGTKNKSGPDTRFWASCGFAVR